MADKKNPSIQEILAAARKADGGGDAPTASSSAAESDQPLSSGPDATESKSTATDQSAQQKPAKQMSVAEMLAAARGEKSGTSKPADAAPASPSESPAAAQKPSGDPKKMSVQEMLAAARAGKSGAKAESKPQPKPKSVSQPKSAAKPGKPASAPKTGPMDTSSILAAARGKAKPGPVSKAEAAARGDKAAPKPAAAKAKPSAPPMPAKPEYAKPKAAAKPTESRRGFMEVFFGSFLAAGFSALTMTGALWSLGVARFFFPNILIEPPSRFKVGFPGDFSSGTVEAKFKAQFGVWIVNADFQGQQQIVALKTVCTHLGCTPNWLEAEQKFKCPCHGSGFYKDGINFEGPAPRPLERYAINVADDGQVEVDKSKTFQEEMGQWTDPASYVPA